MKNLSFVRKGPLKSWGSYKAFLKKAFRFKGVLKVVLPLTFILMFLFVILAQPVEASSISSSFILLNAAPFQGIITCFVLSIALYGFSLMLFVGFTLFLFAENIDEVAFSFKQNIKVLDDRDAVGGFFVKSRLKVCLSRVEYENFMGLKESFNGSIKELMFVSKNI